MENNKQYCILCGAENNLTDKFCHKCGESLEQKDDDLQNYAKEKIKEKVTDEVKGKATEGLLDMLKKFLNSKAYGIILSLSVVAGVGGMLIGGSGVKEFSNSVPGMFSDGQVYGMNFSGQENLFYYRMTAYPGYDESGNMSIVYLDGQTRSDGGYTDLKVTGSDGKTIIDKRIMSESGISEKFCYAVDDMGATIEIRPEKTDETDGYLTVQLGTAKGMRLYQEYEAGDLVKMLEYYDSGIMKYQYFKTLTVYAQEGNIFGKKESFYDELGRLTLEESVNSVESDRAEFTYYENGDVLILRWENGLQSSEWLEDANGNCLKRVTYLDPGVIGYTDVYTYYDNGQVKTESQYGRGSVAEDALSAYYEYYEDGSNKLSQTYSNDGTVYAETIYNVDGTGQSFKYTYNSDGTRYADTVYDFYTNEHGNRLNSKETVYNADGSVRYAYIYDENGNRTLVN